MRKEEILKYLKLWGFFYINPRKYTELIKTSLAPSWGLAAAVQRAFMDALLLYLPIALIGSIPPERSYLHFIATENYYFALIGLAPIILTLEWLLTASAIHVLLRLLKYRSSFDTILNISGFGALAIGSILLLWDWTWILIGGMNQYWLGISHLLIDIWGIIIATICFKAILKVPIWLGLLSNVLGIAVAMPLAIMFMRSPL